MIHPKHVDPVNAAFTPSPQAVDWARTVSAMFADPAAGVLTLDGRCWTSRICALPNASWPALPSDSRAMSVHQAAKMLELLEFFARQRKPATLAELSAGLGWPRSSTFSLMQTLARAATCTSRARGAATIPARAGCPWCSGSPTPSRSRTC